MSENECKVINKRLYEKLPEVQTKKKESSKANDYQTRKQNNIEFAKVSFSLILENKK